MCDEAIDVYKSFMWLWKNPSIEDEEVDTSHKVAVFLISAVRSLLFMILLPDLVQGREKADRVNARMEEAESPKQADPPTGGDRILPTVTQFYEEPSIATQKKDLTEQHNELSKESQHLFSHSTALSRQIESYRELLQFTTTKYIDMMKGVKTGLEEERKSMITNEKTRLSPMAAVTEEMVSLSGQGKGKDDKAKVDERLQKDMKLEHLDADDAEKLYAKVHDVPATQKKEENLP